MKKNAFFVASTGQHVGKTTTCLGMIAGLKKRFSNVGFMKPVGQQHIEVEKGLLVDKDVVLFKKKFHLLDSYKKMNPVLIPKGFTRDYLDGKYEKTTLEKSILDSYQSIESANNCTIVEGTGHVGVGSIIELNNAKVASMLGLSMILIASGGLGSSIDAIAVNKALCDLMGVPIKGIILNKVLPNKQEMIQEYFKKALKKWNIPLLGTIPFDPFLSNPSMMDYASLFNCKILSGEKHQMRHFEHKRLVATSLERYEELILSKQLIITPAMRDDIILATLAKHYRILASKESFELEAGFILTGHVPPSKSMVEQIKKADIPMIYVPYNSYDVMNKISSFTAKIRIEDTKKVEEAIDIVSSNIDYQKLLEVI